MDSIQTNELEQVVLGCLILGAPLEDVSEHVGVNDFEIDEHKKIFKAVDQQIRSGKPVDAIALLNQGLDISSVSKMHEHIASATNAKHYAQLLADYSATRQIRKQLVSANSQLTHQNYLETISSLLQQFDLLTNKQLKQSNDWQSVISAGIAEVDGLAQRPTQTLYSGLLELNMRLLPIHGSRLIILAARPGTGKTALAQQIALESAKQHKSVGIISLEMSISELAIRSFANNFNANGTSLSRGDTESLSHVVNHEGYGEFSNYSIYVDDSIYRLESIIARLSQWKRKHNIDFAIIDHIGLIELSHTGNRNESLGIISRTLKQLCKRLNMPILALCQLNRAIEKENRDPQLSDLRESGHIEQDADMIIILKEVDSDDIITASSDSKTIATYLVKNRVGPKGRIPDFIFKGRTQKFIEK